jgi:hypothetical protein
VLARKAGAAKDRPGCVTVSATVAVVLPPWSACMNQLRELRSGEQRVPGDEAAQQGHHLETAVSSS